MCHLAQGLLISPHAARPNVPWWSSTICTCAVRSRWGTHFRAHRLRVTLDAERLILQMTIGGVTQFLTKAQGMPPQIEKALTRLMRDFTWDGGRAPPNLSLKQLQQPR